MDACSVAVEVSNPLLCENWLPSGLPPFDQIQPEHFEPALEEAMDLQLRAISKITGDRNDATYDNTVVALERSGALLERTKSLLLTYSLSHPDPITETLDVKMGKKLAAHSGEIYFNRTLFGRVKAVYERRDSLILDTESKTLTEKHYKLFVRSGCNLKEPQQLKLRRLNEEILSLGTKFDQTTRRSTNAADILVKCLEELDGLSTEQIAIAAQAATEQGQPGKWLITLTSTTSQPILAQLKHRSLRERIYIASIMRGSGGKYDTTGLITKIAKLRAERARLLGYANHASYITNELMAKTTDGVYRVLTELIPGIVAKVRKEKIQMQQLFDQDRIDSGEPPLKLEPWDWEFYANQLQKCTFAYDEGALRPYFQTERVITHGLFFIAQQLYGITVKERKNLSAYHPDVRVFEVSDANGSVLGTCLMDLYARENKRKNTYMVGVVEQSRALGIKPVTGMNLDLEPPPKDQPSLMTFDEVIGAFHEFGHAIHGLVCDVQYVQLGMQNCAKDFVEFPSQIHEKWAADPAVIANYAMHWQTQEPLSADAIEKLVASRRQKSARGLAELISAAVLDQAWHQLTPDQIPSEWEVEAFEKRVLEAAGLDPQIIPPRYFSTFFQHVFSTFGYDGAYYAYVWSEVLARCGHEWFDNHGGMTRKNGEHFRKTVLEQGSSIDPLTLFRNFYGRDAEIGPMLRARGLS